MRKNEIEKRVGTIHTTNEGYRIEVIASLSYKNNTIKFESGYVISNVNFGNILKGTVANPYHPSVCGIGYRGVGKYLSRDKEDNITKAYAIWRGIISRCYGERERLVNPSYKGCTVDKEWHNFQNFAEWYYMNQVEDFHLDKDILFKGNKIYSKDTCAFIPRAINNIFTTRKNHRGDLPLGVSKEGTGRYRASYFKNNKSIHLGMYDTAKEAFNAYKIAKETHIKEVANEWRPLIGEKTYKALINYQVEITD